MHTLGEEEARTGVPEIVEGDPQEPAFSSKGRQERLTRLAQPTGVPLRVEKTHSHSPFLSPCSRRARTAPVVRHIERVELADLGGLTSPL
jgi:hypothetical protein